MRRAVLTIHWGPGHQHSRAPLTLTILWTSSVLSTWRHVHFNDTLWWNVQQPSLCYITLYRGILKALLFNASTVIKCFLIRTTYDSQKHKCLSILFSGPNCPTSFSILHSFILRDCRQSHVSTSSWSWSSQIFKSLRSQSVVLWVGTASESKLNVKWDLTN